MEQSKGIPIFLAAVLVVSTSKLLSIVTRGAERSRFLTFVYCIPDLGLVLPRSPNVSESR